MPLTIEIDETLWPTQRDFYYEDGEYSGPGELSIVGFIGGWGSSKTHIGARKAFKLSMINSRCPGVVIGPSLGQLKDSAYVTFLDYLETHHIPYTEYRGQRPAVVMPWGNPRRQGAGWIYFRSADKPSALKGMNVGWAWMDEAGDTEKGEEAWQVLVSRVRHPDAVNRQVILTTTGEAPWLEDRFVAEKDERYKFFRASTRENKALHPGYVEQLERELPPNLREVYIDGGFLPPGTGRVYCEFNFDTHVRADLEYNPGLPLCHSFDFNVNPHCSVVCQTYRDEVHVLDEIVLPHATTQDACDAFIERAREAQPPGIRVYGDPSGQWGTTNSKHSDYDVIRASYFKQFGRENVSMRYRLSDPGQRARVNCTNRMFSNIEGYRRLFIHPRCGNLIYDLQKLIWDERGKIDKKMKNRKFGWTLSHASDALAYLIEYEFPIIKPTVTN